VSICSDANKFSSDDEVVMPKDEMGLLNAATYKRYCGFVAEFIQFMLRSHHEPDDQRLYFLTEGHQEALLRFSEFFKSFQSKYKVEGSECIDENAKEELLHFMAAFYCDTPHPPAELKVPENIMHPCMVFSIINTVSFKGALSPPAFITQNLAGLKWICRMTIFGQTRQEFLGESTKLHDALSERARRWLRPSSPCIFSWITSTMRIACSSEGKGNVGRFVGQGERDFIVDGQTVQVDKWIEMVREIPVELERRFAAILDFLEVDGKDLMLPDTPVDLPNCRSPGYWYGSESTNGLEIRRLDFIKSVLGKGELIRLIYKQRLNKRQSSSTRGRSRILNL
jgi:hypothetical protein